MVTPLPALLQKPILPPFDFGPQITLGQRFPADALDERRRCFAELRQSLWDNDFDSWYKWNHIYFLRDCRKEVYVCPVHQFQNYIRRADCGGNLSANPTRLYLLNLLKSIFCENWGDSFMRHPECSGILYLNEFDEVLKHFLNRLRRETNFFI